MNQKLSPKRMLLTSMVRFILMKVKLRIFGLCGFCFVVACEHDRPVYRMGAPPIIATATDLALVQTAKPNWHISEIKRARSVCLYWQRDALAPFFYFQSA